MKVICKMIYINKLSVFWRIKKLAYATIAFEPKNIINGLLLISSNEFKTIAKFTI